MRAKEEEKTIKNNNKRDDMMAMMHEKRIFFSIFGKVFCFAKHNTNLLCTFKGRMIFAYHHHHHHHDEEERGIKIFLTFKGENVLHEAKHCKIMAKQMQHLNGNII